MSTTGGYGPTNNPAYQQQQNTGQNQNSFNRQQQSTPGSRAGGGSDYFNFRQRQSGGASGQSASVSTKPTQGQDEMARPSSGGVQQMQSPVMANGQMSTQPLTWQSPQQQQSAQLRQQQGQDMSKVPDQFKAVAQEYMNNLGRVGSAPEWQNWASNPNFAAGIQGSPEAAAFKAFQQQQQMNPQAPSYIGQMPTNINTPSVNGQAWNPMIAPGLQNATYNPAQFNQQFSQYNGNPNNISQFQNPDQAAIDGQQQNLLQQMLANPHTMNDPAVAALKAKQQETQLALQRSQLGANAQNAASRGAVGSGVQAAQDNMARAQSGQNILNSYRDIDIQKLQQDRLDETNALNSANQFQNSQMNRATQGYNSQLAGQTAREGVAVDSANSAQRAEGMRLGQDQANAQEQWQNYQSLANQDAQNLGVWGQQNSNYFNMMGQDQNAQQLGLQKWLGEQGIGLDKDRSATQKDQFNKGYGLDIAQFLEGRRQFDKSQGQQGNQFNNNMAYQYALLNSNNNNNSMDFYKSLFGSV